MLKVFIYCGFILWSLLRANVYAQLQFKRLDPNVCGVTCKNQVQMTQELNLQNYVNTWNGGGVGIGDFDNDGLQDVVISTNQKGLFLYKNESTDPNTPLKFKDVTKPSGLRAEGWITGVSIADVNGDGFLDLYVCRSGSGSNINRRNLLFINNGDMTFREEGIIWGLHDDDYSISGAFIDYDRDGDLDLYVVNHPNKMEFSYNNNAATYSKTPFGQDRFYRNDGGKFKEVSEEVGLKTAFEFGLSATVADFNADGWPDIFVSNDFLYIDYLYINNQNGTFTESSEKYLKHASLSSMGSDAADFNNDGLVDLCVVDMMPETAERQHTQVAHPGINFLTFQQFGEIRFIPQLVKNSLYLNNGGGAFREIAQLAGVAFTDWSWSPLFGDFDNDGQRDLFVSNGYNKDVNDLDFSQSQTTQGTNVSFFDNRLGNASESGNTYMQRHKTMPGVLLANYLYKNKGNLTFENVAQQVGLGDLINSNGAAYGDLDNDGDLDLVISNIDTVAFVYQNTTPKSETSNYLRLRLRGKSKNLDAIGAQVTLFLPEGQKQYANVSSTRGYQSASELILHFGLGIYSKVDSAYILWPDGAIEKIFGLPANRLLTVKQAAQIQRPAVPAPTLTVFPVAPSVNSNQPFNDNARYPGQADMRVLLLPKYSQAKPFASLAVSNPLFSSAIQNQMMFRHRHNESEYLDFKRERLLVHQHSHCGPGTAVGDVNGDGFEDLFIGNGAGNSAQLFLQLPSGNLMTTPGQVWQDNANSEDTGCMFFDFDKDNDLDLLVTHGGGQYNVESANTRVRLYRNNGTGLFYNVSPDSFPVIQGCFSAPTYCDYDNDGDYDIFLANMLLPFNYPLPGRSYLLKNNNGRFEDVTNKIAKPLLQPGMIFGSAWIDYNQDGFTDLVLAGKWTGILFYKNVQGRSFIADSSIKGIENLLGWWRSLTVADVDNDGDSDIIAGNQGLNNRFSCNPQNPITVYGVDYDLNGSLEPLLFHTVLNQRTILQTRDLFGSQAPIIRNKYYTYKQYANASEQDFLSFSKGQLQTKLHANYLASVILLNEGNGRFTPKPLPHEAQIAPLNGLITEDLDNDQILDIVAIGNVFETYPDYGRDDALNGVVLKGVGDGTYRTLPFAETNFYVGGNGRSLATMTYGQKFALKRVLVCTQSNDSTQIYALNQPPPSKTFTLTGDMLSATLVFKNKSRRRYEAPCGNSGYMSCHSPILFIPKDIMAIEVIYRNGVKKIF